MNKIKKIALLTILPIAVLLLSGCGKQTVQQNATPIESAFNTPNPAIQNPEAPKDPSASSAPLPPLPTDNKQAIDSEIQGIDQEFQTTDAALSADAPDNELGL